MREVGKIQFWLLFLAYWPVHSPRSPIASCHHRKGPCHVGPRGGSQSQRSLTSDHLCGANCWVSISVPESGS